MSPPAAALGLALALALAGCTFLRPEGEESLTARNLDVQPLSAVVRIEQIEGGFVLFDEAMMLGVGAQQAFALALRPGPHAVSVTTSTGIVEAVGIEIPERGDTAIDVAFRRGGATVTTTSG